MSRKSNYNSYLVFVLNVVLPREEVKVCHDALFSTDEHVLAEIARLSLPPRIFKNNEV